MNVITEDMEVNHVSNKKRLGFFKKLEVFWMRLNERSRVMRELESMSDRELADLGLNRSDIADVARGTWRKS